MKEINYTNILQKNMNEKTKIVKEIRYKRNNLKNSPFSSIVINYDKTKVKRNKNDTEAVDEILSLKRFFRKSPEINCISSSSNDVRDLKKPYSSEMKRESEGF